MEFRCLLARLGYQLIKDDTEKLMSLFQIPKVHSKKIDMNFHVLFGLEGMGHINCYHPDRLQEILENIGRKELAKYITDYKESVVYKESMADKDKDKPPLVHKEVVEDEEEKIHSDILKELLPGVNEPTDPRTKRLWDMFAVALTRTKQLKMHIKSLSSELAITRQEEEMMMAQQYIHLLQQYIHLLYKTFETTAVAVFRVNIAGMKLATTGLIEQTVPNH